MRLTKGVGGHVGEEGGADDEGLEHGDAGVHAERDGDDQLPVGLADEEGRRHEEQLEDECAQTHRGDKRVVAHDEACERREQHAVGGRGTGQVVQEDRLQSARVRPAGRAAHQELGHAGGANEVDADAERDALHEVVG